MGNMENYLVCSLNKGSRNVFLLKHFERRNSENNKYGKHWIVLLFKCHYHISSRYYKGRNDYGDYKYGKQCIGFLFKGHELCITVMYYNSRND